MSAELWALSGTFPPACGGPSPLHETGWKVCQRKETPHIRTETEEMGPQIICSNTGKKKKGLGSY